MAKKPDLSGVKTFFFNYGERVALGACVAVALLLVFWGLSGATGPGTATGKPWQEELSLAAKQLKAKIPAAPDISDEEKNKLIAEVKFPPVSWDPYRSYASPGPYQNINELPNTQRNNPTIFNVLAGNENFQMDYVCRGWQYYDVRNGKVLAFKEGGTEKKGPAGPAGPAGPGNFGALGGYGPMGQGMGGAGSGGNLVHVLQPKHMLVVTGIFPMKKQVDEFVKALRLRDVGELAGNGELPVIVGINVFREEYGPDGKRTHKEQALPLIFYNPEKERLEIQPALQKELTVALYDHANPQALRPVIHEGLVTPLPLLPEGHVPKLRIKGGYWPKEDMVAEANEAPPSPLGPMGPQGPMGPMGPQGPMGLKGPGGFKGGSSGGQPPILGGKIGGGSGGGPPGPGGGMPGVTGGNDASPELPTDYIPLKKIENDKDLYARLAERRLNIFHPYGQIIPDDAAPAAAANGGNGGATMQGSGVQQGMMGAGQAGGVERFGFGAAASSTGGGMAGVPGGAMPSRPGDKTTQGSGSPMNPTASAGTISTIYDAIVRFVDVDVKPLHSYRYYIQVRAKNPNYGKKKEVAQQIFASFKELRSDGDWTPTPLFTVPGTYHLFAVDQFRVDQLGDKGEKDKRWADYAKKMHALKSDEAVLQLHRWFGREGDYLIGDWAIAEWLRVRKGEAIGHPDMIVEIPTWNPGRGGFEMRSTLPPAKGKKAEAAKKGVPLDFVPKVDMPPLLVDFDGGKRTYHLPNVPAFNDEAAMDLLILTPEGRLIVRNTRADIDVEIYDGTPTGTTRQLRVEQWRKRNRQAEAGGASGEGGGGGGAPSILPGR